MSVQIYMIAGTAAAVLAAAVSFRFFRSKKRRDAPLTDRAPARVGFASNLRGILGAGRIDDDFWVALESTLIASDAGIAVTRRLMEAVRRERTPADVRQRLSESMTEMLTSSDRAATTGRPHVIMVLGVNGAGKTTTIAKLARMHMDQGRRVLLVAGDTYRAAAIDQLSLWAERLGCEIVAQMPGADAAAVAHDGVARACARGHDVVIVDTAGRLHTKQNLMDELSKISRVVSKAVAGAPHEKLLVMDATVGSNGLVQARRFNEAVGITGVVMAKLDGTAKGGVVLAMADEVGVPVTHIGTGEGIGDIAPFDAGEFVESMLK